MVEEWSSSYVDGQHDSVSRTFAGRSWRISIEQHFTDCVLSNCRTRNTYHIPILDNSCTRVWHKAPPEALSTVSNLRSSALDASFVCVPVSASCPSKHCQPKSRVVQYGLSTQRSGFAESSKSSLYISYISLSERSARNTTYEKGHECNARLFYVQLTRCTQSSFPGMLRQVLCVLKVEADHFLWLCLH